LLRSTTLSDSVSNEPRLIGLSHVNLLTHGYNFPMATVVLGVSGSIAAYKAADLASQLVKAGIDVHPVLTPSAAKFIQPATFRALTGNPTPIDVFDECCPGEIAHIHLAKIADLFAIVPASMNLMARLAHGFGDDMLTASVMATKAPILLAPGMNTVMWDNPATQANLETLKNSGYYFIEPVMGRLACRTEGKGKMADVDVILNAVLELLARKDRLAGKKVLITAGPTREPIDPVRYISNRSSGKMGFALAEAARCRGAEVTVIAGPTTASPPGGVKLVKVETARQMYDETLLAFDSAHYVIAAAAVADFRPADLPASKIKKEFAPAALRLSPTDDLLAELGRRKQAQVLVGFAAETDDLEGNALKKLSAKNLDWIVANDISKEGAGFDGDTNIVDIYARSGSQQRLPLMTKREAAEEIWDTISR
jgi:phosphopantothenoylcysteine decarboxylase / phosphopantothenate---cysteine ligase